jgi:hypothetical protein
MRTVLMWVALVAGPAAAAPFLPGDVFTSINYGRVQHWSGEGELLETLDAGGSSYFSVAIAGCTFDAAGNLFFAWNNRAVRRVSGPADPHEITPWGIADGTEPTTVEFDHAGNAYVSMGRYVLRYNEAASPDGAFVVDQMIVSIDLAPDDCTMLYTRLIDATVYRRDVCRNEPLPAFASRDTATSDELELALTVRLLGDGSALVTTGKNIVRLDAGGHVIQSYDVPGEDSWMPLGLDPNGSSFWAGDANSGRFYRFDIGSGAVERGPLDTGAGHSLGRDFTGICVFGADSAVPSWTTTTTVATSSSTTTMPAPSANPAPDCSTATAELLRRRRRSRRLAPVRIRGIVDPDGDRVRVRVTAARVDGSVGDACPAARGAGKRIAWLRTAAADGERVYRLSFRARDRHGAACRGSLQVCVPPPGRVACRESAGISPASPCP